MMTKKVKVLLLVAFLFAILIPGTALADDWFEDTAGYYTVTDEAGYYLFMMAASMNIGDEYISSDNKLYRIVEVDSHNHRAAARFIEDLEDIDLSSVIPVEAAPKNNRVALYCTHSDESYVPTDGTESIPGKGGIFDVSKTLTEALNNVGCEAKMSSDVHEPHDAGAYRRSRQTAVQLMKQNQPAMLCDIHRDAVPPEEYEKKIDGKEASRIRIVIGRSNQNRAANEQFARAIKQVADKKYPGLIKDIFVGKGSYNQDLMPRAILFECGTHTIKKDRPEKSMEMLADVIAQTLGVKEGGTDKNTDTTKDNKSNGKGKEPKVEQQAAKGNAGDKGAWTGVWISLGVIVVLGIIAAFLFTSGGERTQKFKAFWGELTGIGKKRE